MPFYEYRCERGHVFDVMQRMSDERVTTCTTCGAPVQRVFRPPAIHFKGSGFYTTDYGRAGSAAASDRASNEGSGSSGDGGSSPESSGGGEKKSESGAKETKKESSTASSSATSD